MRLLDVDAVTAAQRGAPVTGLTEGKGAVALCAACRLEYKRIRWACKCFFHSCRVLGHSTTAYSLPRLPEWVCAAHLENAVVQASAEERAAASVAGERPQMGQHMRAQPGQDHGVMELEEMSGEMCDFESDKFQSVSWITRIDAVSPWRTCGRI